MCGGGGAVHATEARFSVQVAERFVLKIGEHLPIALHPHMAVIELHHIALGFDTISNP